MVVCIVCGRCVVVVGDFAELIGERGVDVVATDGGVLCVEAALAVGTGAVEAIVCIAFLCGVGVCFVEKEPSGRVVAVAGDVPVCA